MARRNPFHQTFSIEPVADRLSTLEARARRLRTRGERRKAIVLLREICLSDERCARRWCLYGELLGREGRVEEAHKALKHALWLRRSAGDQARTRSTQRLIDRLGSSHAAA
jgi:tetratricopeptide (TPR) repeat protein